MLIATLILALAATPAPDHLRDRDADAPVILDFTASWCGPCQQMKPNIDGLVRAGYPIKPVDFDTSPLKKRYKVSQVPTFVIVDPDGNELDRALGYMPAADLAAIYKRARAKYEPRTEEREDEDRPAKDDDEAEAPSAPARAKLPQPWETVVRIRIEDKASGRRMIEFGSGTIIHSSEEETIILTCAHIFRVHGQKQFHPKRFPNPITVELSDGVLRQLSPKDRKGGYQAGVHMVEAHEGEAIDYDFGKDVGLIRIRPGKKLPATPVVSADWKPVPGLKMTTVGCSEGRDATAWSTQISNPSIKGVDGHPDYEAIECVLAPKQGRSGGGLYTLDGKLAGVCDFAEPTGNHGLYATPRTIHWMLDRNKLSFCYAPDAGRPKNKPGTMLAGRSPKTDRSRTTAVADTLRAQNGDDPAPGKRLTIPSPDALQIPPIAEADEDEEGQPSGASKDQRRKPTRSNKRPASSTEPADMTMTPEAAGDPFGGLGEPKPSDVARREPKELPSTPESKARGGSAWKAATRK